MKLRFFLLLAALMTGLGTAFSQSILPEKLTYQKTSTGKLVPYRDGVLVQSEGDYMFARFEERKAAPLEVLGIEYWLDVEIGIGGALFLGAIEEDSGEIKVVMAKESPEAKPQPLSVPDEFHACFAGDHPSPIRPRLIRTNHEAAAMLEDVVWWLDKATWKHRKLPKIPKFHDEFLTDDPYQARWFLDGNTLYGGWDHGEWRGALASLDLGEADSAWVQLSGKTIKDDSGTPENHSVKSIVSPHPGELWVAVGSSHMGLAQRGLYHREPGGKWQTLIHGVGDEDHGKLKPFFSAIDGLALDREGVPYLLAGSTGIYRVKESALDLLIAHDFQDQSFDQGDYTVSSTPSEIAVARNGDIFVSTNCLGVLAFRKTANQWSGRQITVDKQKDEKPDADSSPRQDESPGEGK
ncbi:MAG: hypothetical protein EOP83_19905 [Verrucomicrobiaceae bacterium]|nr:MAG: hypothetical protein EOP83_19905 [Verrucomicrobiaceae bacterium]